MNKSALKKLKAKLVLLKDAVSQWVVCAINCVLSNPTAAIAKQWLREELERYLRRQSKI